MLQRKDQESAMRVSNMRNSLSEASNKSMVNVTLYDLSFLYNRSETFCEPNAVNMMKSFKNDVIPSLSKGSKASRISKTSKSRWNLKTKSFANKTLHNG